MHKVDATPQLRALQQAQAGREVFSAEADDDAAAVEGWKPHLPEQWYDAKYIGHETAVVFMSPKCFLHFEIVEPGEYMGTRLFRAFRVRRLVGRSGKGGRFAAHAGGDLYVLLCRLLDLKQRTDRITFRPLRHMLFRVKTRTVTTNYKQQSRPEQSRYSVIEEIEREQ